LTHQVLQVTVAVWIGADFEAITYQVTTIFDKSQNLETHTNTAINYTAC
jgi:hypothetical protein